MAALKPISVKNFPQAAYFQSVQEVGPVVGPGDALELPASPAVEEAEPEPVPEPALPAPPAEE